MGKGKPPLILFGLEVLAISSYVWHQSVSAFIGWNRSWRVLHILLLLALTALFSVGLWKLLTVITTKTAKRYNATTSAPNILRALVLCLSPSLFLSLIFLPYIVFLKDIRGYLLPSAILASAYLLIIFYSRLQRSHHQAPSPPDHPETILSQDLQHALPKHLPLLLFTLSLLINIALASGLIFPQQPFTGDEPHYLLTTQSILQDGDINVYNNYRNQGYLAFYPGELEPHAYVGKQGERHLYSKHFPGLSVLLVPTYFVGDKVSLAVAGDPTEIQLRRRVLIFFSRLPLCFFTALLGALFFLAAFDVTKRKDASVLAWVFFCFTTPILFYSHLLYAEIVVALLALYVVRNLILNPSNQGRRLLMSGAAIGLLPWFGVKYLVLSALLFGVCSLALVHREKLRQIRTKALHFLPPILVSAAGYLLYFWALYGNFSAGSVYRGAAVGSTVTASRFEPFGQFISESLLRFLGFFIDQKFGLLIYSPIFLLGVAGFYFMLKKRRREAVLLMTVLVVNTLFSAAFYWGGHCPPPRPLIPVLTIWGLFMAIALAESTSRFRSTLTTLCGFLSFGIVWACLRNPWLLYPEQHTDLMGGDLLYAKLFRSLSNAYVQVHTWLPSLTWEKALSWLPIVFWAAAIALLTVLFISKTGKRNSQPASLKMAGQAFFAVTLCFFVLLYAFFDIQFDREEAFPGGDYTLYFQDNNHFGQEVGPGSTFPL